ncbi:Gustatory receptor 119b, partial [Halyomorpha halys]
MVPVTPCQLTIGKIDLVLNDVFKFSRFIGTFPIDHEYSGISKLILVKCVILNLPADFILIFISYQTTLLQDILLSEKLMYAVQTIPPILFCWVHLAWIMRNKCLLKELYDEFKDTEYHLWKSGISWIYKPNLWRKYLSVAAMLVSSILWDIFVDGSEGLENFSFYIIHTALITIVSQYVDLVQVLLSFLREIRTIEESKTVIMLTDKLFSLCQKIIAVYEPQLFLYIVVVYLFILFTVYDFMMEGEAVNLIGVIWILSFMSPLILIVICVGEFYEE